MGRPPRGSPTSMLLWINFPLTVAHHCNSPGGQAVQFESHLLSPTANLWQAYVDPFKIAKRWLSTCLSAHDRCRTKQQQKIVQQDWDAIHVTEKLGLRYIWIDALCIIQQQQDNSDWLRESGCMRSIYRSAHVNLAASAATSVHEGLICKPKYYSGGFYARVSGTTTTTTTSSDYNHRSFHSRTVYEEASTCSWKKTFGLRQSRKRIRIRIHFPFGKLHNIGIALRTSSQLPEDFYGAQQQTAPNERVLTWVQNVCTRWQSDEAMASRALLKRSALNRMFSIVEKRWIS
ncbi:hypothetical protein V8F06_010607 [Rhypophila decipiens]